MHVATISAPLVQSPLGIAPVAVRTRRSIPGLDRLRAVIRQSRRHGLWIVLWTLIGWAGTALAPALAGSPFLLMMMSPRALFVALASNSVPLVPFVLLGTARLGVTDASYYIIGKRFPRDHGRSPAVGSPSRWRRSVRLLGRKGDRLCAWFCARPRLAGAFLFCRPNGKYLALAGAYGVPAWIAGICSAAGTATFLTLMHVGLAAIF